MLCHVPHSVEQAAAFKARLSDLDHAYCNTPGPIGDFSNLKECIQTIKSL